MNEEKIQKIGKINLDLTYYPGEDFYCDGAIEDELLRIARDYSPVEFRRIIEEERNWEILYHLSSQRENIVEWLPIRKNMKVLEVGSGCGAITGALADKAGSVTCIDLSKKRSMINAYRHMDCDNVTIQVGNFQDIEPSLPEDYDYICLIGVFEYGQAYIGGTSTSDTAPFEQFLHILKKHMKKDGHLVIAIENKFGLKYWAGCKEDHLGTYFSGLEGYPEGGVVRTFTRPGLEEIFGKCGIDEYEFFYPYPDYKFMTTLFSDERLPAQGELSNNRRNFDRDRMQLFDERKVFDSILRDGLFSLYSNSYVVVIGPKLAAKYVRYSNDRQTEYQIRTEILAVDGLGYQEAGAVQSGPKMLVVRKHPLSIDASDHIRNMANACEKLRERYAAGELRINRCKLVDIKDQIHGDEAGKQLADGTVRIQNIRPYVEFEYVNGVTLAQLMDECLDNGDTGRFMELFEKYLNLISVGEEKPVADYDLVFSNILISSKDVTKPFDAITNSVWTLIDYEWTFGKQVDTKELAFRAVYCYILENEKRNRLSLDLIMERLQISDKDAAEFREQELGFQRFVTGNRRSMIEIRDLIGRKIYEPETWIERMEKQESRSRIQIYEDRGAGINEEDSYFITPASEENEKIRLEILVNAGMKAIRIDPGFDNCIVTLRQILWNEKALPFSGKASAVITNGVQLDDTCTYLFHTMDPNIYVSLEGQPNDEVNMLEVEYEIAYLSEQMAEHMEKAARRRIRL